MSPDLFLPSLRPPTFDYCNWMCSEQEEEVTQINEDDNHSSTRAQKYWVCDVHKNCCTAIVYLFTTDSGIARQQHSKSFINNEKMSIIEWTKKIQDLTKVLRGLYHKVKSKIGQGAGLVRSTLFQFRWGCHSLTPKFWGIRVSATMIPPRRPCLGITWRSLPVWCQETSPSPKSGGFGLGFDT